MTVPENALGDYLFPEKILCSAIHFDDGKAHIHSPKNIETGYVVCGFRHCNCFNVAALIPKVDLRGLQGFLTNRGNFVDRVEAGKLAFEAKQTKSLIKSLTSEDLY